MTRDLANVLSVYQGSNGDATRALYADLTAIGPIGVVAVNLFRACKCSERAKVYRRGPGHKTEAYARKDWSIGQLADVLVATQLLTWGWQVDERMLATGDPHHHVVYVDIPTGQVSFHVGTRHKGPDYAGEWDRAVGTGPDRICRWVATLFAGTSS